MTAHSFVNRPLGTALARLVRAAMEVILHIGAHRTATTTFQHYLRQNENALLRRGIAVWGPRETRKGLFHGILPSGARKATSSRAKGRIGLQLEALERRGVHTLLVSDENMLGTMNANLRNRTLYHDAGQRVAHFVQAFDAELSRIVLSVRGQDRYWASATGYVLARGRPMPSKEQLKMITHSQRAWRDVVTDVACAAQDTPVTVTAFDRCAGQPEAHFKVMTGQEGPKGFARDHLNASVHRPALRAMLAQRGANPDLVPDGHGRWNPFSPVQTAALADAWYDDHHWLRAGAGGCATYIEDPSRIETGPTLSAADLTRGHITDDRQNSRMAQTR